MTVKRTSTVTFLCLSVVLAIFTFVPGCSFFRTTGEVARFWEWLPFAKMDGAKIFRGKMRLLPQPDDAQSHYALGCSYQQAGRHEEAIAEFEKAIAAKPDFIDACSKLGMSYDQLGHFERAEKAYLAALHINPGMPYIHNNLGVSCLRQDKGEEAIVAFKRAIELNGDKVSSRMYNNLGIAYAMTGQYGEAMEVFEGAFGKAEAHYRMARVYRRLGMAEEADKEYASAAELDPTSPVYRKAVEEGEQNREFSKFVEQVRKVVGIADPAAPEGGGTKRERAASDTAIEISNGNGVLRMARNVSRFLKERGFTVVRLTNADSFTYPETVIHYREECESASVELAKVMPEMPKMKEVNKLGRPNVKIKVLLGKDLVAAKNVFVEENR